MPKRSIGAQIEEVARILEDRRSEAQRARGAEFSRNEEHILRLESVLATLEWVRDHADVMRQMVRMDKAAARDQATRDREQEP